MKKITFIITIIGMFTATLGQFLWAIFFWNNDEMFMNHWTVGLVGFGLIVLGFPYYLYKTRV